MNARTRNLSVAFYNLKFYRAPHSGVGVAEVWTGTNYLAISHKPMQRRIVFYQAKLDRAGGGGAVVCVIAHFPESLWFDSPAGNQSLYSSFGDILVLRNFKKT